MERIVRGVADRAGEGTVFIQVAGDATHFESFKPARFFGPDEIGHLANDFMISVFPEKTFRGQRLSVKGATPFFELFRVAGAALSRRRMAVTKIRYLRRGIRLTISRAVRRCRLPRGDFPERAEEH